MRILIVEDEVLIAMHLEMLLVEFGHEVCGTAFSAERALALASTHRPDVTLMDIHLSGGGSGIHAAREMLDRYGLRCIFLSGNLDEAHRNAIRACNPVDSVSKPVLPLVLKLALEKAESGL